MTNWLLQRFGKFAQRTAIVDKSGSSTYALLLSQIEKFDSQLKQVPAGSIVVISSDFSFESIALLLACFNQKQIIVPILSDNRQEIKEKISASGAGYILSLEHRELLIRKADSPNTATNSLCEDLKKVQHSGLILFSSGSTGKPKAMLHDLSNLLDTYQNKKSRKLSILVFLLFDHIGGINTLLNILSMGAKAVIADDRSPESIAAIIERERVSILPASPTFLNLMLLADVVNKYDLSCIRMITYGTETMPESLLKRIKDSFPNTRLLQTFGTSETGIAQINSRSSTSLDIKIDDPNLEYKIVNGELWLKSKTRILGYLNESMDSFDEDGWFCTGDLVEQSDDGYIKIIGRSKELINVGGEKVLPIEVESVLLTSEQVKDCMVYGVANAITGQTVVADIVIADTKLEVKELKKQIRSKCASNLERYKIPTKYNFVDQLTIGSRFKKMRNKA